MKFKHILTTIAFLFVFLTPVLGYEAINENFDTSLVSGLQYQYQEPNKILFTQIEGNYEGLNLNSKEYLNTIYYYSITKLKLGNIPFHYAIDENGEVFKTQNNDALKLTDDRYIVVAYLSNNGQISNKARESFLELSNTLSYSYGISQYEVKNLNLEQTENSLSKIILVDSSNLFSSSVEDSLKSWEISDREHLEYKSEIVNVENESKIDIGNKLQVKVTVKNLNEFTWFSSKYPIYVSVKDSKESIYAVNKEWDSFSKPLSIASDRYVLPGQTVELVFNLDPKVLPGENTETFNIFKFQDEIFANSEFKVDFNVDKGDNKLVKLTSPEYGFINIRECRWYSCEKIEVANDGEVYIVVKEEEGWYQIQFGQDKEGWVYSQYAKEI